MKKIVYLFLLLSGLAKGQDVKEYEDSNFKISSIQWAENLTWEQVKEKARLENKYIFLDCFATWCLPCKKMDKEVYINDSVVCAVNKNFIAVKIQIDSSKKDNELIKKWYASANSISKQYKVTSFPTFLFLSPEGKIVHKSGGYQNSQRFISLLRDALDSKRQLYTLLNNYKNGIRDYSNMKYLAELVGYYDDKNMARQIALDYINNCLSNQNKKEIYARDNISFIFGNVNNSKEKSFELVFKNSAKVNKILAQPGFAEEWISYIITKEEIQPTTSDAIKSSSIPDWDKLKTRITVKYNSYYANRTIIDAKTRWYASQKNWHLFTKYSIQFLKKYGDKMSDFNLAQKTWLIFLYSMNKRELKTALKLSKHILERSKDSLNIVPAVMDTYANLVYKINYLYTSKPNSKAIDIEEKAKAIADKYNIPNMVENINRVLGKMQRREITWIDY